MVRAIIAGTKAQTRRAAKFTANGYVKEPGGHRRWHPADPDASLACPYGQAGDRLWVKEAWRAPSSCDHLPPRQIAQSEGRRFIADEVIGPDPGYGKFRHGMFMPRWASRILLEVTATRLERLQIISEADAIAEGIAYSERFRGYCLGMAEHFHSHDPRQSYQSLWHAINGPDSWEANPFVWVTGFRVLEKR